MSEKLCLQWNDFRSNVSQAFGDLREDLDFADVTLACEDGQQVEAHKVILATSSPFFKGLLVKNKHAHPLIYMRGVKSEDLTAMVDFLYCGEANVPQENLDSFLALAEELKLKGLMGTNPEAEIQKPLKSKLHQAESTFSHVETTQVMKDERQILENNIGHDMRTVALVDNNLSEYMVELDSKVKSMMEKGSNMISVGNNGKRRKSEICKICGKEGQTVAIRDHIERNHLEGISLPCNVCGKTFRSRHTLRLHKSAQHRE